MVSHFLYNFVKTEQISANVVVGQYCNGRTRVESYEYWDLRPREFFNNYDPKHNPFLQIEKSIFEKKLLDSFTQFQKNWAYTYQVWAEVYTIQDSYDTIFDYPSRFLKNWWYVLLLRLIIYRLFCALVSAVYMISGLLSTLLLLITRKTFSASHPL